MIQFQSNDETGFLEILAGGSVFYRDREGEEHYLEWDSLPDELQQFLSTFIDDVEAAFDEAMVNLKGAVLAG